MRKSHFRRHLRPILHLLLFLLFIQFSTNSLCAQDANYWSSNFGPGGFLTPGATVANNRDSGVFFFNPALLAYSTHNAASLSGTIYQYQTTNIKNGAGTGLDLKSSGGAVIPQLISNSLTIKTNQRSITVAYALMHEPNINFQTTQRKDDKFQVLDDSYSPGPEYFLGQFAESNVINTTTGLVSIGTKLSKRLAVGFSMEGNIRKQVYNSSYSAQAFVNSSHDTLFQPITSSQGSYIVNYVQFGLRFKGGLAYDIDDINHIGLTISSPLIHIGGSATLVDDNQVNNLQVDSAYNLYLLASTRQTGLKPRYKMPLSIAFGYTHDFPRGQLFLSTEYFLAVNQYNIINPRNSYFIRPDTANNYATSSILKFVDARKAIFNVAAGMSYILSPVMTGYLGLRTDFTYARDGDVEDGNLSNTSNWNQYHAQIGVNIKRRKLNLRAGLLLTYGLTNKYEQPVNYDDPSVSNLLVGDAHETSAHTLSAGLLLSYLHNF